MTPTEFVTGLADIMGVGRTEVAIGALAAVVQS